MHSLYSYKIRPDLPKLRNATLKGMGVEWLRYDKDDCYALFQPNCKSIQVVKIWLTIYKSKKAWFIPSYVFDDAQNKWVNHPTLEWIN